MSLLIRLVPRAHCFGDSRSAVDCACHRLAAEATVGAKRRLGSSSADVLADRRSARPTCSDFYPSASASPSRALSISTGTLTEFMLPPCFTMDNRINAPFCPPRIAVSAVSWDDTPMLESIALVRIRPYPWHVSSKNWAAECHSPHGNGQTGSSCNTQIVGLPRIPTCSRWFVALDQRNFW